MIKKDRALFLAAIGALFGLGSQLSAAAPRLQAEVVDDATGKPLAARVALTDANGKFVELDGTHDHVQYLDKRWCYVDGTFTVGLPDKGVQVEIRRGFETRPLVASLTPGANRATIQKIFRLRRWVDLRQRGYFNGDFHAHVPVPKEAHLQMRAEDLNALTLLCVGAPEN